MVLYLWIDECLPFKIAGWDTSWSNCIFKTLWGLGPLKYMAFFNDKESAQTDSYISISLASNFQNLI